MLGVVGRGRSATEDALFAHAPGFHYASVRRCVVKKSTCGFCTVPVISECLLNVRKRQPKIKPNPGLAKPFKVWAPASSFRSPSLIAIMRCLCSEPGFSQPLFHLTPSQYWEVNIIIGLHKRKLRLKKVNRVSLSHAMSLTRLQIGPLALK